MNQIAATCQQSVDAIAAINPRSPFLASDTLNGANHQSSACYLLGLLAPAVPPPPPSTTFIVQPGYIFSSVSTNTIAFGNTWIINSGITLYIPAGITLNNYGTIQINPGGTLFNNGVLTNNYQISNSSSPNANFINGGVYSYKRNNFYPAASVIFNNYGSVTGAFNIQNGYSTNLSQFIINNGSPTQNPPISTYFTITNGGTWNCYGAINNTQAGTFSFTGTQFTTTESIFNSSSMTFNSNFSTTSSIQNESSFTINGNGAVSNLNTITNGSTNSPPDPTSFTITNGGTCSCNGPINNNQAGTFSFTGTQFTTTASIGNISSMTFNSNFLTTASIVNGGSFKIEGLVSNLNTITNGSTNSPPDPTSFTITNGGTCSCNGPINNNQAGTFSFTGTLFTTTAKLVNLSSMTFYSNFSTTSSIQNGSSFTIKGAVSNLNTITNGSTTQSPTYFTITNGGTCTCNGPINNNQNGTFSFTGTQFTNANGITITNVSTMIFTSNLTNNGTITNTGKITATGSVTGNTATPIAVNSLITS